MTTSSRAETPHLGHTLSVTDCLAMQNVMSTQAPYNYTEMMHAYQQQQDAYYGSLANRSKVGKIEKPKEPKLPPVAEHKPRYLALRKKKDDDSAA